ncbi:hypothetical protein [Sphingobacterium gobiense]|uniref:Uncharacterized protein n=1 Tax=Sphingobacterium gobiense TaxID=1382456 RepID=A0A2S9JTU8_9SPHI|nr:hypothetical protein [Sphingobacterium gobiense]PRD56704.1 hypothetical protein C5749_05590 [Sphingobacterium gobiense]
MSTLKKYWLRAITAFTLALGVMYFAQAFDRKSEEKESTKVTTVFHYVGDDTSEGAFANPDNWEEGSSPSTIPCGSGQNKPCEKSATDKDELTDMLEGRSNSDILNDPTFSTRQ